MPVSVVVVRVPVFINLEFILTHPRKRSESRITIEPSHADAPRARTARRRTPIARLLSRTNLEFNLKLIHNLKSTKRRHTNALVKLRTTNFARVL